MASSHRAGAPVLQVGRPALAAKLLLEGICQRVALLGHLLQTGSQTGQPHLDQGGRLHQLRLCQVDVRGCLRQSLGDLRDL